MKNKTDNKKTFKKLLIKIIRKFGYEVIDQANLNLPSSNLSASDNLSKSGFKSITIPWALQKLQIKLIVLQLLLDLILLGTQMVIRLC